MKWFQRGRLYRNLALHLSPGLGILDRGKMGKLGSTGEGAIENLGIIFLDCWAMRKSMAAHSSCEVDQGFPC